MSFNCKIIIIVSPRTGRASLKTQHYFFPQCLSSRQPSCCACFCISLTLNLFVSLTESDSNFQLVLTFHFIFTHVCWRKNYQLCCTFQVKLYEHSFVALVHFSTTHIFAVLHCTISPVVSLVSPHSSPLNFHTRTWSKSPERAIKFL